MSLQKNQCTEKALSRPLSYSQYHPQRLPQEISAWTNLSWSISEEIFVNEHIFEKPTSDMYDICLDHDNKTLNGDITDIESLI